MKNFRDFLKEEVLPTVQVADGGLDISKPAVRAAINAAIAGVVSQPAVTPYVVFNRLSKLLAQYHIVLPKRFLEGDKGVEVFELRQFGHKMGMTDSGEFVNEVPSTHYLFLQYGIITPFGITYAKPVVGGMFKVMARIVDKEELDKLIDMAEITMAEEAEVNQAIAKANAPREEMHDITSDEKKKGNKEAVGASEKKSLAEVSLGKLVRYKNKAGEGREKGLALADKKMKGKAKVNASAPKNAYMEEDKDPCWKGYEMIGMKKKKGKPVPNCVPVKEETDAADETNMARTQLKAMGAKSSNLVSKLKGAKNLPAWVQSKIAVAKDGITAVDDFMSHSDKKLGEEIRVTKWSDDSHTARVSKDGKVLGVHTRKKHSDLNKEIKSRFGVKGDIPKGEEPGKAKTHKIDEISKELATSYFKKATKDARYEPAKKAMKRFAGADLAFKKKWGGAKVMAKEEQIDELNVKFSADDTSYGSNVASAKKLAVKAKKAGATVDRKSWDPRNVNVTGNASAVAKIKHKMKRRYDAQMSEEQIDEKAPPGAKFERMVKHIKKGYAKDGELTAKEKGIAFATAWKAKNREKGE